MIVLTGNVLGNGIIGETSYWRSAYTVMAWREGGWRQVIVSGGGGGASMPVGEAMKIFLESGGIPADAISIDSQSLSTRESALNLARILPKMPSPHMPGKDFVDQRLSHVPGRSGTSQNRCYRDPASDSRCHQAWRKLESTLGRVSGPVDRDL
jgi:DUF218 domain